VHTTSAQGSLSRNVIVCPNRRAPHRKHPATPKACLRHDGAAPSRQIFRRKTACRAMVCSPGGRAAVSGGASSIKGGMPRIAGMESKGVAMRDIRDVRYV